jgi:hypothetical protein
VRKVESEAAQRAREAPRSGDAARSGDTPRSGGERPRAGDAFRATTRPTAKPGEPAASSKSQSSTSPSPRPRPPLGQEDSQEKQEPRSPRNLRADAPRPQSPPSQLPGMRGFRDITADADDLGRAAAQANRAARKTFANVPSPSPEFDRQEPSMENRGADSDSPYSYDESVEEAERYAPPPQGSRARATQDKDRSREPKPKRARSGTVFPFKSAIAVGVVLILVGAAILWGKPVVTSVSGLFKASPTVVEAQKDSSTPLSKPKIPDRVGQPSSTDQIAPIAQRVVLYDEDPTDPKGKQYVGSVIWRTEQIKASAGQKADIAVRADIEIPDRKFKMTMSFRRNTDASLPASHTAELTFVLPPDFAGGGVGNVPGLLMKSNEQARGTPLAGLAVKVTDGFFLVGLSNVEVDRARNLQLMKERSWFDVPLVYVNQRRAIIAIEKGAPGERVFNEAFATWGE